MPVFIANFITSVDVAPFTVSNPKERTFNSLVTSSVLTTQITSVSVVDSPKFISSLPAPPTMKSLPVPPYQTSSPESPYSSAPFSPALIVSPR